MPTLEQPKRIIPIAIDKNFTQEEQSELWSAIYDWNIALNGQMKLEIHTTVFDMEDSTISYIYNADGILMLKVSKTGSVMQHFDSSTIAVASQNQHSIFFIKERLRPMFLKGAAEHEIAHMIGSKHSNHGLMKPEYDGSIQCIDKETAIQVADYNGLVLERMNWCE